MNNEFVFFLLKLNATIFAISFKIKLAKLIFYK